MEPKYLKLTVEATDGTIQPVRIEVSSSSNTSSGKLSSFEEMKIKNILRETYGIENVEIICTR